MNEGPKQGYILESYPFRFAGTGLIFEAEALAGALEGG